MIHFTKTFGLKAQIKPIEMVACDKDLDEKYGFLVLANTTNTVSELHQRCPQAVWFFSAVNDLTEQSLGVMLANSKVYEYTENHGSLHLSEAYCKDDNQPLIKPWGVWNIGVGLAHIQGETWQRRRDMTNVCIEAATLEVCT